MWGLTGCALKQCSSGTGSRACEGALARLLVAKPGAPLLPDEWALQQ